MGPQAPEAWNRNTMVDARGQAFVYIVDDDAHVRLSERKLLETQGYRVIEFPSAEEFLAQADFDSDAPQCLVLDLRLPGMDGTALQRELLRRNVHISIVVQTGFSDVSPAVNAMKAGAIEVLEKPVNPAELIKCVAQALSQNLARRKWERERGALQVIIDALSLRERQVMEGLVAGNGIKELSAALSIGTQTVLKHRASMLKKLGAKNDAHLVMLLTGYEIATSSAVRTARVSTSLEKGLLSSRISSVPSDDSSSS